MSEILFLAHRIPYPPDKGDKIRSYHWLRALAERHTVHLGTFIDDPADWTHVEAVKRMCEETCIRALNPSVARFRSAAGFLRGEPLTLAYYDDRELRRWILELATRRPLAGIFVFSSSMAQYAEGLPLRNCAARVIDFCDVDSDKWRQYAATHRLPLKAVYAREARTLAMAEARYVREFDASIVISEVEAQILRGIAGGDPRRVQVVTNGVDIEYFDPARQAPNPFPVGSRPIVFTGAMDYQANVDGVQWFAREVLPKVKLREPSAVFVIVGSNPLPKVRALAAQPSVIVTGRVPDVRPYLAHAGVVVAPLRIARGLQNKVLEALAMARPVVATENAIQGIPDARRAGVRIAQGPDAMVDAILAILGAGEGGQPGRDFVQRRYGWDASLSVVTALFPEGRIMPSIESMEPSASA
jgi:sugar transferase (PEP-CTERM/EpsH1 system associated)